MLLAAVISGGVPQGIGAEQVDDALQGDKVS
jgi:hypothetical protein